MGTDREKIRELWVNVCECGRTYHTSKDDALLQAYPCQETWLFVPDTLHGEAVDTVCKYDSPKF